MFAVRLQMFVVNNYCLQMFAVKSRIYMQERPTQIYA